VIDWPRAAREKRRWLVPIVMGAVVNVVVYAAVIYPLSTRAGGLEARSQNATIALSRASADFRAAEALRTGRARADEQLTRFYGTVLPASQTEARRITYPRLAKLADESNLDYERRSIAPKSDRESALSRMDTTMVLSGEYRDVRRFIHRLETSPEFVVIEDVALVQGERDAPLTLTMRLSTFYKAEP
jgi:hypothetical protein